MRNLRKDRQLLSVVHYSIVNKQAIHVEIKLRSSLYAEPGEGNRSYGLPIQRLDANEYKFIFLEISKDYKTSCAPRSSFVKINEVQILIFWSN